MQGEWEGEEEDAVWISSSESPAADQEVSPEESEEEEGPDLQAIAAVVLQDQREREEFARRVARAGGIEPARIQPAPVRAAIRGQERERRQLEIARRVRDERRRQQAQARIERQRAREAVQAFRVNIRAAAKRIAADDPVRRRVEERRVQEQREQRSRSPRRDRDRPTRS